MEAIGSILFLLVFLAGLVLLFKKGNRFVGLIIVLFAGFVFLYYSLQELSIFC